MDPKECGVHKDRVGRLWDWFMGNGNLGAGERLRTLEELANGNKETASMKKIEEHLKWHETASNRRWELVVGIILILISQGVTLLLMIDKFGA